jgi:hypothetical protein
VDEKDLPKRITEHHELLKQDVSLILGLFNYPAFLASAFTLIAGLFSCCWALRVYDAKNSWFLYGLIGTAFGISGFLTIYLPPKLKLRGTLRTLKWLEQSKVLTHDEAVRLSADAINDYMTTRTTRSTTPVRTIEVAPAADPPKATAADNHLAALPGLSDSISTQSIAKSAVS